MTPEVEMAERCRVQGMTDAATPRRPSADGARCGRERMQRRTALSVKSAGADLERTFAVATSPRDALRERVRRHSRYSWRFFAECATPHLEHVVDGGHVHDETTQGMAARAGGRGRRARGV